MARCLLGPAGNYGRTETTMKIKSKVKAGWGAGRKLTIKSGIKAGSGDPLW
jgi:hypothetical protein